MYKIKLDEIIGESTLVMNVEFLGIDRKTKQSQQHPFNGGNILKRGIEWEDNSDIVIADRPFTDNKTLARLNDGGYISFWFRVSSNVPDKSNCVLGSAGCSGVQFLKFIQEPEV